MKKEEFSLFPTLVTRYSDFLEPEQITAIYNFCKKSNIKSHGAFSGNASSSHASDSTILKDLENFVPECQGLTETLTFMVNTFALTFGYRKSLEIGNSWFNIQEENSVLKMHTHPGSVISAAFYINTDSNSSRIFFENPNNYLFYLNSALEGNVFIGQGSYACTNFVLEPKIGDLVLFPGWLKHGSGEETNKSADRLAISFNTSFVQR